MGTQQPSNTSFQELGDFKSVVAGHTNRGKHQPAGQIHTAQDCSFACDHRV